LYTPLAWVLRALLPRILYTFLARVLDALMTRLDLSRLFWMLSGLL
jgi:hypothetical protein